MGPPLEAAADTDRGLSDVDVWLKIDEIGVSWLGVCREGFGEEEFADGGVLPANALALAVCVSSVSSFASSARVETIVLRVRAAERLSKSANAECAGEVAVDAEAELELVPTPCRVGAAGLPDALAVEDGSASTPGCAEAVAPGTIHVDMLVELIR